MKKIVTIMLMLVLVIALTFTVQADSKEIVINGGFEVEDESWVVYDAVTAVITYDNAQKHSGKNAMYVSDKTVGHGGVQQEITQSVKFFGKGKYHVSAWIFVEKGEDVGSCSFVFQLISSDEASTPNKGKAWALTALTPLKEGAWVQISGDVDFTWAADLTLAEIYIYFPTDGVGSLANYYIDDISLVKVGYTGPDFVAPTAAPEPTAAPTPTLAPPTKSPVPPTVKPTLAPGQTEKPTSTPKNAPVTTSSTPMTLLIGFLMAGGGILIGGGGMYFILKKKQVKVNE